MRLLALASVALCTACASPPNTPGAGVGKNYTPIIDLRGVNGAAYLNDLDSCRNSAAMIDADRQELAGLIGGALIGAAVGASISSDSRVIGAGANSGALHGGLHAGAAARSRQAIVMGNCMASRGYRVIDGTANVAYFAPMPGQAQPSEMATQPAVAAGAAVSAVPVSAPNPTPPLRLASDGRPAIPGVVANPEAPDKPLPVNPGKDVFVAEQLARRLQCTPDGSATLVGKGPGYETYSFACKGSETLVVRCEYGNCRALR